MKIVFFSSDNNAASGAFRAEINLIKDLQSKGHDVTLILPFYGDGKKLIKMNNIKTKHILSVPWVCPIKNGFVSKSLKIFARPVNYFASLRMRMFLERHKIDLAVINTLWTGAGAAAAKKCKIPVIWHMREILEVGQNHTFINSSKSFKLINQSKKCLAVSNYVKCYYSRNIKPKNVEIIYDGIDRNVFYNPNKQLFKDTKTHFLMLGTVNEPKGQHIGLKALNALSKYDFDVKIVGVCSEEYKRKLLSMAPNLQGRILFFQPTTHPEKYYKQCDIFLMNSIGEAFGLVTAESMMSGLVTVAAKCGASKEIIDNDNNGYFYAPQDWEDLSLTIEKILLNKKNAIQIAKNGQKRSLLYFDRKINSEKIEKIYYQQSKKE